jgi:hypothetical protein
MKLPVWRRNRDLLEIMRSASIERFLDPEARTDYSNWNETWHRTTGQVIDWAFQAPAGGRRQLIFEELRDLVLEARLWRPMAGAIASVSSRKFIVHQDGKKFGLVMAAIPDLEFLDMLLERRAGPRTPIPPFPRAVNYWFVRHAREAALEELDDVTAQVVFKYARRLLKWERSDSPESAIDDGFNLTRSLTMKRALDLYATLLGLRIIADGFVRILNHMDAALMSFTEERAVELFADADPTVQESEVSEFIELMTYRPGQSAHISSTPFVPFEERLIFAPALVVAGSAERTLLRAVAANPDRFGSLGQQLGRLADRVATVLKEISGISVLTRVQAVRENRTVAGDIDVLAIDPKQGKVLAIEVKWPVEALTLKEASKVEADVRRGAAQLHALQLALSAGEASLPSWVDSITRGMQWSWFVATPSQLSETGHDDIYPTSLRHLQAILPVRNLSELEMRLHRRPQVGEHFEIGQGVYRRLGMNVRFDTIEALVDERGFFGD